MLRYIDDDGRIYATDDTVGGSPIIFDTAGGNLFADPASDYFTGSFTLPARSAASSGVDGSQATIDVKAEYFVGVPSSPNANIVLGQCRISTETFWPSAWGTHVLDLDGVGNTLVPQTDTTSLTFLSTLRAVTPVINSLGHIVFRERTIIRPRDPGSPPTITKSLAALTIEYKVFAGAWWGSPYQLAHPDIAYVQSQGGAVAAYSGNVRNGPYAYPGDRRMVVAVYSWDTKAAPTALTIDGGAATIHGSYVSGRLRVTIASRVISGPGGTTVPITVTHSGSLAFYIETFIVRATSFPTPTITSAAVTGNSISLGVTVPSGSQALIICLKYGSSGAWNNPLLPTWTNAEVQSISAVNAAYSGSGSGPTAFIPNVAASSAIVDEGSVTVSTSWNGASGAIDMVAVVFS